MKTLILAICLLFAACATTPEQLTFDWSEKPGGYDWVGGTSNNAYWESIHREADYLDPDGRPTWRVWMQPICDTSAIQPGWLIGYRLPSGKERVHFAVSVHGHYVVARGASNTFIETVPYHWIYARVFATDDDARIIEHTIWRFDE